MKALTPGQKDAAEFYLSALGGLQPLTRDHVKRVARYSSRVAKALGKDVKAAYMGGLFHDIGKLSIDKDLFCGGNVTKDEYAKIQEHSTNGWSMLKDKHLFSALVAGAHHNMCTGGGYGVGLEAFSKQMSLSTVKKALDIATIVSVCDFIDAFQTRKTALWGGSAGSLKDMLYTKFSNDKYIVDKALEVTCAS